MNNIFPLLLLALVIICCYILGNLTERNQYTCTECNIENFASRFID